VGSDGVRELALCEVLRERKPVVMELSEDLHLSARPKRKEPAVGIVGRDGRRQAESHEVSRDWPTPDVMSRIHPSQIEH
jgi:hypothetical protein